MDDENSYSIDDEDSDLLLFEEDKFERLPESTEDVHLDQFLAEAVELKRSTEQVLQQIADLPAEPQEESPAQENLLESLSLLKETLSQFSHVHSTKLDALGVDLQETADIIDGRIALAVRTLSEGQDQVSVSVSQLANDLKGLEENLFNLRSLMSAFKDRADKANEPRTITVDNTQIENKFNELGGEILRTVDAGNLGLSRKQQDVESRLAKLETLIIRSSRKRNDDTQNAYLLLVVFLLFVNMFMILWIRFMQ